jgi:hypothetical protein
MSANRSVQAAQRRRAGPQEGGMPGTKGPQPSINSAQLFANQARPGSGPNMPTGRLAGQQAAMQQKQMQQPQQHQQQPEGISGVSKMTIAQAITLITLRLGAVETKMMALEHESPQGTGTSFDGQENMVLIDKNVIQSIVSRLESLEKRSTTSTGSSVSGPEVALLKQQFETVKQAVIQTKGATVTMKTQVDSLKNELIETRELLSALQNLTMENSQKLMGFDFQNMDGFSDQLLGENIFLDGHALEGNDLEGNALANGLTLNGHTLNGLTLDGHALDGSGFSEIQDSTLLKEIVGTGLKEMVGTSLKKLIESEINAEL